MHANPFLCQRAIYLLNLNFESELLLQTPACGTDLSAGASADAPLPPGFSKMRKVELEKNFPIWVKKASQEFDDQVTGIFMMHNPRSNSLHDLCAHCCPVSSAKGEHYHC